MRALHLRQQMQDGKPAAVVSKSKLNPTCHTHPTGGIVAAPALRDHRPPAFVGCHVTLGPAGCPPVGDPVYAILGAGVQVQQYFAASDGITLGQTSGPNTGAVRRRRHSSHFVHRGVQCRAVGALKGGGAVGQQWGGGAAAGWPDSERKWGRRRERVVVRADETVTLAH